MVMSMQYWPSPSCQLAESVYQRQGAEARVCVILFCRDLWWPLGYRWKLVWSVGLSRESFALVCLLWFWKNKPVQPALVVSVVLCGHPAGLGRKASSTEASSLHFGSRAPVLGLEALL